MTKTKIRLLAALTAAALAFTAIPELRRAAAQQAVGAYARFRRQATAPPPPSAGFSNIWIDDATGTFYGQNSANVNVSLGGGATASNYQTVQENTVDQTQRAKLNFSSAFDLSDSSSPSRTTVGLTSTVVAGSCTSCSLTYNAAGQITVAASGGGTGYSTIENDDTPLAQESTLNCDGTLVVCSAGTGQTEITLGPNVLTTNDFQDVSNKTMVGHLFFGTANTYDIGTTAADARTVYTRNIDADSSGLHLKDGTVQVDLTTAGLNPGADATLPLGTTSLRYSDVVAKVGTIYYNLMGTTATLGRGLLFRSSDASAINAVQYSPLVEMRNSTKGETLATSQWALQSRNDTSDAYTTSRLAVLYSTEANALAEIATFISAGLTVAGIGTTSSTLHAFPTGTGALASIDASQTLTNKTISGGSNTLSAIPSSALSNTAVTAGSYTNTNLTVNAQGQITAAANGSAGAGDMVLASTQTVTGAKTYQAGTLLADNAGNTFASTIASLATAARTWSLPDATDTAVGKATTDTLTNKTLTAPVINGATSASGNFNLSGSSGTFLTCGGANTLSGDVTIADTKTLTGTNNSITTGQTVGWSLQNTTSATLGAQKFSPMIELKGSGNASTTINAPVEASFALQVRPVQGATAQSELVFWRSVNSVRTEALKIWMSSTTSTLIEAMSGPVRLRDSSSNGIIADNAIGGGALIVAGTNTYSWSSARFGPSTAYTGTSASSSAPWPYVYTRHLAGVSAAVPTCVTGTGAGISGSPTCTTLSGSTDLAGTIEVNTATSPAGSGATVATVTFNTAYATTPRCVFSAADSDAAAALLSAAIWIDQASGSTTTAVMKNQSVTGLAGTTTFDWNYHCTE